jgi:hypothetical protein
MAGELPGGYDVFLLVNLVHYWSATRLSREGSGLQAGAESRRGSALLGDVGPQDV